jgi:hypothetical protein
MRLLAACGAGDLAPDESDFVRMAADAMLFAEEMDGDARTAADQVATLCRHLVESERWERADAEELMSALTACGPAPVSHFS